MTFSTDSLGAIYEIALSEFKNNKLKTLEEWSILNTIKYGGRYELIYQTIVMCIAGFISLDIYKSAYR
jgi:hypothetical protein